MGPCFSGKEVAAVPVGPEADASSDALFLSGCTEAPSQKASASWGTCPGTSPRRCADARVGRQGPTVRGLGPSPAAATCPGLQPPRVAPWVRREEGRGLESSISHHKGLGSDAVVSLEDRLSKKRVLWAHLKKQLLSPGCRKHRGLPSFFTMSGRGSGGEPRGVGLCEAGCPAASQASGPASACGQPASPLRACPAPDACSRWAGILRLCLSLQGRAAVSPVASLL